MGNLLARSGDRIATVDDVQAAMLAVVAACARGGASGGGPAGGAGPTGGPVAARAAEPAITELLPQWRQWLTSSAKRKASPKHAASRVRQVLRVCLDLGVERPSGLDAAAVLRWFDERATVAKPRRGFEGLSARTKNDYRMSLRAFAAWCRKKRGLAVDDLGDVGSWDQDVDRRHPRRATSAEDLAKLVAAAERGPAIETIPGPDRAILYVVAAYTGFRKKELGSLTPASFDLAADAASVRVEARWAKSRRERLVPLHPSVAAQVRDWLARKAKTSACDVLMYPPLWPIHGDIPGGRTRKTHRMIARDLAAAGLPYRDALGFADLHACRHTFGTNLARAGVPVKVAQELLGHADPALTLKVYTHVLGADKAAAVLRLPPPPALTIHPSEVLHGSSTPSASADAGVGGGAVPS